MRYWLVVVCVALGTSSSYGQSFLKGIVIDTQNDSALTAATVYNLTQRVFKRADAAGKFAVTARPMDSVIFSATGYRSDTIVVSSALLGQSVDIGLKRITSSLEKVVVRERSYSEDSAARREDYESFYKNPPQKVTTSHDAGDGFGLKLSPVSYFSKKQRQKRKLKKQLDYNEEQAYVDYYFSPNYVRHLTSLPADSLQVFMVRYRPQYKQVRQMNSEDLLRYTNDALIRFRNKRPVRN